MPIKQVCDDGGKSRGKSRVSRSARIERDPPMRLFSENFRPLFPPQSETHTASARAVHRPMKRKIIRRKIEFKTNRNDKTVC